MKDRYIYPALVEYDGADKVYYVHFPDIDNAFTFADTEDEIMVSAREVLELCIYDLEEQGLDIPEPTNIAELLAENKSVMMVETWMPVVRDRFENKAIRKTLTIPKWLNDLAVESNVNFSQLLQTSLRQYLGIDKN